MAIVNKSTEKVKEFKIPEGMRLKDTKLFCKKHGEITDKSFFLSYILQPSADSEDKRPKKRNHVFCTACLCEYLESLKESGVLAEIGIVPVFEKIKEDENVDKVEEKLAEENS